MPGPGQFEFSSPTLRDAYALFRLDRQGNLVTPNTLEHYDRWCGYFFDWLEKEDPGSKTLADLDVNQVRAYKAHFAATPKPDGKPRTPSTIHASHRALNAFFHWADNDGLGLDPRILKLKAPRLPKMEATVYTAKELQAILEACNNPTEALMVRLLVGAGMRASEVGGICVKGPDGLNDLMADSMDRGRAELRVRWDAGAKGKKTRRVPITAGLALEIRRYITKYRRRTSCPQLLITKRGTPFGRWGVDSAMDRIERRVGFRVHAHAFRHTFATVCTQNDWNLEKLRAAMGHSDYSVLQRYVHLAAERDLGPRKLWAPYILLPQVVEKAGW